jgi:hypothetical protein
VLPGGGRREAISEVLMDDYLTSSIVHWYEELEDRLLEFLKFFPLIDQNLDVASPRLADLITETCNILDSLFRECLSAAMASSASKIDVVLYAKYYTPLLGLHETKSFVFVSPPIYITPFEGWSSIVSSGCYTPLSTA